jgi:lysophospholipase L1-like esterase
MHLPRLAAALATVALLTAGCSSGSASTGAPADPTSTVAPSVSSGPAGSGIGRYVALGDSYSAGPLIPTTDLAGGCARSDHNYPSLVAKQLDVGRFVDVTCGGATTRDLTHVQATFGGARVPPQLRAVTPGTDLVTLGIGGNDLDLFATLVGTCTRLRASDPTGSPCARALATNGPDLVAATRTISANVTTSLREVRRRAPKATVVLVGYLRLVPDHGTCPKLPLAAGDYAEGRRISQVLDRALQQAARRTGVRYVDMYDASKGHDVCAADPWVNGGVTDRQRALAYHPFASGMRADAARVVAAVGRG